MSVALPAHSAHDFNGQRGDAVGQDRESVILGLSVEHLEAGDGDDTGLDSVLLLEVLGGLQTDGDLRAGRDKGDLGAGHFTQDVTTLASLLDGRAFELRKVLSGQRQNARSVLGGQCNVVSSAGLVTIGRAPDHAVGQSAEVSQSLDGLVGRPILSKTDGVMGGDPNGTDLGQSRETDGTGSIGDKVEESTAVRQNGAVGSKAVHDGTHGVLTNTIADVSTRVVSEASGFGLEVNSLLPAGQVGASQVCGATKELGNYSLDFAQHGLGKLARGNGRILRGVDRQALLPALGKIALLATLKVSILVRVLFSVLGDELVPLLLVSSALGGVLAIEVVNLFGDVESLLWETPLLLQLLDIVGLQGRAVDTMSTLLQRAETNGGLELDQGGLILDCPALLNGSLHASEVTVTVLDDDDMPAVSLISLDDVFSEGAVGVAINGDVVVIVNADEVAQLEVTCERRSLARDTLHQATVTEKAVCVVVNDVETRFVEGGSGVSLSHGQTNSIADTLAQGTSGNLNSGGVMGLGVAGSLAVDCLCGLSDSASGVRDKRLRSFS